MPFVTSLDFSLLEKLRVALEEKGFSFSCPPHTVFCAKQSGISCTLYLSGKLVVQGKSTQEFVEFFLEPEILGTFSTPKSEPEIDMRSRIGVDESGKGDFFGPLSIAGVAVFDERTLNRLYNSDIKDSKKISDKTIPHLAKLIKECSTYEIVRIEPEKYNLLYEKFRNLNHLLAWGHAKVLEKLSEKIPSPNIFAISDKFADDRVLIEALKNKNLPFPVIQRIRAESDIVVAAASILAREDFILSIKKLEKIHNLFLPKGGGSPSKKQGLQIAREYGLDTLRKVCKRHFKTYDEIAQIINNKNKQAPTDDSTHND